MQELAVNMLLFKNSELLFYCTHWHILGRHDFTRLTSQLLKTDNTTTVM